MCLKFLKLSFESRESSRLSRIRTQLNVICGLSVAYIQVINSDSTLRIPTTDPSLSTTTFSAEQQVQYVLQMHDDYDKEPEDSEKPNNGDEEGLSIAAEGKYFPIRAEILWC
jgi:hypothetical protein